MGCVGLAPEVFDLDCEEKIDRQTRKGAGVKVMNKQNGQMCACVWSLFKRSCGSTSIKKIK